jgi:hypothetical protein
LGLLEQSKNSLTLIAETMQLKQRKPLEQIAESFVDLKKD